SGQGRRPQLPPREGPRAELPGADQPRTPDWGDTQAPLSRASLDTPRGHDEQDPAHTARMPRVDDRQGPGSTAEIPRIDDQGPSATGQFPRPEANGLGGPTTTGQFSHQDNPQQTGQFERPRFDGSGGDPQDSGQFVRSDVFGTPAPRPDDLPQNPGPNTGQNTGQFAAPQGFDGGYDGSSTGQHALPGRQDPARTGQFERPQPAGGDGFGAPRPQAPQQRPQAPQQRPVQREPEALPPATGPVDGRTPLYDTLETNWFHGGSQEGAPAPAQPQQPQAPAPAAPQRGPGGNQSGGNTNANGNGPATGSWRTSPNDELVRQAERVRQPAAGGVTTSGLPRRVPRANLVPGTAQQQQHQAGPQVSRAPDDVRGRLTNLRRGIAQGRQAGSGQTGSYPSPTHQQER
ncbi:hypothetical protein ABT274_38340, partial [Streptomyces sp. NPDC001127]